MFYYVEPVLFCSVGPMNTEKKLYWRTGCEGKLKSLLQIAPVHQQKGGRGAYIKTSRCNSVGAMTHRVRKARIPCSNSQGGVRWQRGTGRNIFVPCHRKKRCTALMWRRFMGNTSWMQHCLLLVLVPSPHRIPMHHTHSNCRNIGRA